MSDKYHGDTLVIINNNNNEPHLIDSMKLFLFVTVLLFDIYRTQSLNEDPQYKTPLRVQIDLNFNFNRSEKHHCIDHI